MAMLLQYESGGKILVYSGILFSHKHIFSLLLTKSCDIDFRTGSRWQYFFPCLSELHVRNTKTEFKKGHLKLWILWTTGLILVSHQITSTDDFSYHLSVVLPPQYCQPLWDKWQQLFAECIFNTLTLDSFSRAVHWLTFPTQCLDTQINTQLTRLPRLWVSWIERECPSWERQSQWTSEGGQCHMTDQLALVYDVQLWMCGRSHDTE